MDNPMKAALIALSLLSSTVLACEASQLGLSGSVMVPTCFPSQMPDQCRNAGELLGHYMEAVPDSDDVLTIGIHSSPWHLYDTEMRILSIDEFASSVRSGLDGKVTRIELIASWTAVSPSPGVPSLAAQLSDALGGFPVSGESGFLWLNKDGTRHTTRQAFTVREGAGSYSASEGEPLLVSLVAGWPAQLPENAAPGDAYVQMRAAAGKDILLLCPDKALLGFEHAAEMGNAVAAYNAAIMRLERSGKSDRAAALALLERGAALGDEKSRVKLDLLRSNN